MTNFLAALVKHGHARGYGMNLAKVKEPNISAQYLEKKGVLEYPF